MTSLGKDIEEIETNKIKVADVTRVTIEVVAVDTMMMMTGVAAKEIATMKTLEAGAVALMSMSDVEVITEMIVKRVANKISATKKSWTKKNTSDKRRRSD